MPVVTDVVFTSDDDDHPLLRKLASAPIDRERLVHEASLLALAQRPGIVEVAGLTDAPDTTELTLLWAGDRSPRPGSLDPRTAATLLHRLCNTVAGLHQQGITHGRIGVAHLVLAADGSPVLCGFSGAFLHTGNDPARLARGQAADVAALGELLTGLLASSDDTALTPEHRHRRSADERRAGEVDTERRALLTLADQAAASDPETRPSAERFGALLASTLPAILTEQAASLLAHPAAPPTSPAPPLAPSAGTIGAAAVGTTAARQEHLTRPAPLHRLPTLPQLGSLGRLRSIPLRAAAISLGALAGVALLITGVVGLRQGSRPHVGALVSGPQSAPRQCPPSAQPATTFSGTACPAAVHLSGRTVSVATRHFVLGKPGDVVAIGAWRCDGDATPALLRPDTGEIFVFDAWASPGHDVTVHPAAVLPNARALTVNARRDGCDVLSSTMTDGSGVPVPLPVRVGS